MEVLVGLGVSRTLYFGSVYTAEAALHRVMTTALRSIVLARYYTLYRLILTITGFRLMSQSEEISISQTNDIIAF